MADQLMTGVLGKWRAYLEGAYGAGSVGILILKSAQADGTLRTHNTVAALLAASGNTEADWSTGTAYARKTGITPTVTQGTALVDGDIPDQTWTAASTAAAPQQLAKAIAYWRFTANTADTASVPLCHLDYPEYANGADLIVTVNATGIIRSTG